MIHPNIDCVNWGFLEDHKVQYTQQKYEDIIMPYFEVVSEKVAINLVLGDACKYFPLPF